MKNTILSFALPLLLALAPAAVPAADTLWVNVPETATVVDAGGAETSADQYQSAETGNSINAFRVSVSGAGVPGGTNQLAFVYEDGGSTVAGDASAGIRSLDPAGGAFWAPVDLGGCGDSDPDVTLELGHTGSGSSFETLAVATAKLSALRSHVSSRSDLNPPAFVPWEPDRFLVPETGPPASLPTVISVASAVRGRRSDAPFGPVPN